MKLFSEKVNHTSTNSFLNILQTEEFEEIFFGIYQVKINKNSYPLEKISDYKGFPVVSIPVVIENQEIFYPFILSQGKQKIIFNENNIEVPIENPKNVLIEFFNYSENELIENKEEILNSIEDAKKKAESWIKKANRKKISEANDKINKNKKSLDKILKNARESLVEDFLNISQKIKEDLFEWNIDSENKLNINIEEKINIISQKLSDSIKEDFNSSAKHFDKNVKSVIKELYSVIVIPKIDKELKNISTDIAENFSKIDNSLQESLTTKADIKLIDGLNIEIVNIQKANIELNESFNKAISKALSKIGNISKDIEFLSEEIDKKLEDSIQNVSDYYSERIQLLEDQNFELNETSRKYFIELITDNKNSLVEEIRKIKDEKSIELIIESKDPEKVNLDKLKKEYDKIINDKIADKVVELRKYIHAYGGGGTGTVAMQFANGGVMSGNLTVVGVISASQYLGLPSSGGGSDVSGLSSNWQNSYTIVRSNSANWNSVYGNVFGLSSSWNNSYNTVLANSATWSASYNSIFGLSGNWQNTYNTLFSLSSNWNNGYNSIMNLSSNWQNSYNTLFGLSGNWNNIYSIVLANSANWNNSYSAISGKANLNGGNLFIGNQNISGNLSATGSQFWGLNKKFYMLPDWTGFGELSSGSLLGSYGNGSGSFSFFPSINSGDVGAKVSMGYSASGGTNVYSAVEVENVSSGFGTLKLMKSGGNVLIGTINDDGVNKLQVNGGIKTTNSTNIGILSSVGPAIFNSDVRIAQQTPATASSPGVVNTIAFDNNFIYLAVANNTWKRAAISTW